MGDFNAKVGEGASKQQGLGPHGLGVRNESGEKLLTFCQSNQLQILNTLFKNHPRRKYTWISPNGQHKNQIDYILVSKEWTSSYTNCKTRPGADHDTDHILLVAKLKMKGYRKSQNCTFVRFDLEKLQKEAGAEFKLKTENRFEALLQIQEEKLPEELWQEMKQIWKETAESTLGKQQSKKPKPWISQTTIEMADAKRKARVEGNRVEYNRLKRTIKRQIREDREAWLDRECNQIQEFDSQNKGKELFNKIKVTKRKEFQPKQLTINNTSGKTLTEPDDIMKRWKEYGEQLFDSAQRKESMASFDNQEREPPPLLHEVENAINSMKNGKSPGLDNIPAEFLKASGPNGLKTIHTLCCKIWNSCQWPAEWKQQELVMLHKAGSTKECGNYRTIALISHTSKIMLYI